MTYHLRIKCPYCGNTIMIVHNPLVISLGANLLGGGGHLSISRERRVISSYHVKCDFCGRKYKYFDFEGNYAFLKNAGFVKYTPQVAEWFSANGIDMSNLPSLVVGVIEPEGDVFTTFKNRLKRKFRRPVTNRFVEVIFEVKIGDQLRRGVLHGRIREVEGSDEIKYITLEYAMWL